MKDESSPSGREVMQRFGLRADPFSPVHDSRFLMGTKPIRLALGSLRRLLDEGHRLIAIRGEPGVGKTALGDAFHGRGLDGPAERTQRRESDVVPHDVDHIR